MSLWDLVLAPLDLVNALATALEVSTGIDIPYYGAPDWVWDSSTPEQQRRARRHAAIMLGAPIAVVGAPAAYAYYMRKKKQLKPGQERLGIALENSSNAAGTLLQTTFASPVIAAAYTYILVQKLETGKVISKGLGDAVQTLLAISAAGPAIQGISSGISAFARKK